LQNLQNGWKTIEFAEFDLPIGTNISTVSFARLILQENVRSQ